MRNIKLTIAYDGTNYRGWQSQGSRHSNTVQQIIEEALQKIFLKKPRLIGSGRTDAGVHALAQTANFKIDNPIKPDKLKAALNALLPKDIAVLKVEDVILNFHARFDTRSKTYIYCIFPSTAKTPFVSSFAWCVRHLLDLRLMRSEAKCLLGKHNFKSFQASEKAKRRSVTTVNRINIKRVKNSNGLPISRGLELVTIEIEASGFLRNMVRNIAGTLVDVGRGKFKKGDLAKILKKQDRKSAGRCAPSCGLYLADVVYGKL
ncbi:MAG: tRNA pseudouridine(38-40) synthase TruA [Candidatus Omnitrophota bacterium]